MIKPYKNWKEEQTINFTDETAYNAGVSEAKAHYEEEAIATAEYYQQILQRTATAEQVED